MVARGIFGRVGILAMCKIIKCSLLLLMTGWASIMCRAAETTTNAFALKMHSIIVPAIHFSPHDAPEALIDPYAFSTGTGTVGVVLVGMIIEKRLTKSYVLSTIVASSVLGGLLICAFYRTQTIFFGMGFITNAYIGCLFACYLADKDKLRKPERLLAGVLLILKLVHLGVGLAWIKYGMNSALLKSVILVASFLVTWKMCGTVSRFVSNRRTNERQGS